MLLNFRNKIDNKLYFYFGDKAQTVEEREFYKYYEYNLNLDLVPNDTYLNSITHQGSLDLNEILYHAQPYNFEMAIAMRPGFEFYKDWQLRLLEDIRYISHMLTDAWRSKDGIQPWSFVKSEHDYFYILNPLQNHIFIDNNVDSWIAKSEAEGLRVIEYPMKSLQQLSEEEWEPHFSSIEGVTYDADNYRFQTIETYKNVDKSGQVAFFNHARNNPDLQLYSNSKITGDDKIKLFQKTRKTIVYHSIYEKSFKTDIEKFENKISFDHFEDMFELNIPQDSVVLLGGLPTFKFMGNTMTYDQAVAFTINLVSQPKTSVWAKCVHTDQEIFIND